MDAGHDVSVIIEARNETEARQHASRLRIALSEVTPLSNAVIAKASARRGPRGFLIVLLAFLVMLTIGTAGGFYWIHLRLAGHGESQTTTTPMPIPASIATRLQSIEADLAQLKINSETTNYATQSNAAKLAEQFRSELQDIAGEALSGDSLSDGAVSKATVLADLDRLEKERERVVAELARNQQQIDKAVDGINNSRDSFERERWRKFVEAYETQRATLTTELERVDGEIYSLRKSL